jgi:fluoride exporter
VAEIELSAQLLIAIGGFAGAISRYGVNLWMKSRVSATFPFGTFGVNLLGSLLLGWLLGANAASTLWLLAGTGFLGSFTTFSTFQLELFRYVQKRQWRTMLLYGSSTYGLGLVAAAVGYMIGQA